MGTFLAFVVAVAKLFYAQPWSKILLLCFAVFIGGCVVGVKLTRSAVKAVAPETKPERTYPLRPWKNGDAEPVIVEAKPEPTLPEAVSHFVEPTNMVEPKASATACVGGNCSSGSRAKVQARPQRRRLFGGWR